MQFISALFCPLVYLGYLVLLVYLCGSLGTFHSWTMNLNWSNIQFFNSSIIHFTNGQFSNSLIYRLKDHLQLDNSSIFQDFLLGSLTIGQFLNLPILRPLPISQFLIFQNRFFFSTLDNQSIPQFLNLKTLYCTLTNWSIPQFFNFF